MVFCGFLYMWQLMDWFCINNFSLFQFKRVAVKSQFHVIKHDFAFC